MRICRWQLLLLRLPPLPLAVWHGLQDPLMAATAAGVAGGITAGDGGSTVVTAAAAGGVPTPQ